MRKGYSGKGRGVRSEEVLWKMERESILEKKILKKFWKRKGNI